MYALKLAFSVPTLVCQKFMRRNDVNPISSQPKKNITRLPASMSKLILSTKAFNNRSRLLTQGSYLKYAKVKKLTNTAIVMTSNKKLYAKKSRPRLKSMRSVGVSHKNVPRHT